MASTSRNDFFSLVRREKRVIAISFILACGQLQYAFDAVAVSGFQSMPGWLMIYGYRDPHVEIGWNISVEIQRLIQSLVSLGGIISAIVIHFLGKYTPRRVGLWVACLFSVVAVSIQIGGTDLASLYIGRLFLGISNGYFLPYSVVYMAEIAPTELRGSIVGMATLLTSLGALFATMVNYYTSKRLSRLSYQIPLAVLYIVPVILSIALLFLPDTPRYYITKDRSEKARKAISRLRGIKDPSILDANVAEIELGWEEEKKLHNGVRLMDMFRGPDLRRTLISFGASVGQTATGVVFMSAFSVYFFIQARVTNAFMWVMVSLVITLTANILSFPAMRILPRRTLLISCGLVASATMFTMAAVYDGLGVLSVVAAKALVGVSIVYTWFYGLGLGPVLWAVATEVPSQRLRSQTLGLGQGLNFVFAWLSSFCTPYFINPEELNWGPKYCYIWGASNLILSLWVFFLVPETKGRSLEQMDALFDRARQRPSQDSVDGEVEPSTEKGAMEHTERL